MFGMGIGIGIGIAFLPKMGIPKIVRDPFIALHGVT